MVLAVDQYCVVLSQFKTLHDRHKLSCVWWAEWNHNLQQDWGDPPILVLPMPISCYYHGHGIIYFNVLILWFLVIFCELWSSKKESKLVVDLPIAWCLECGKSRWLLLSPINHSQFLDKMPFFFWQMDKMSIESCDPVGWTNEGANWVILKKYYHHWQMNARGNLAAQFWAECWHTFHQIIFFERPRNILPSVSNIRKDSSFRFIK